MRVLKMLMVVFVIFVLCGCDSDLHEKEDAQGQERQEATRDGVVNYSIYVKDNNYYIYDFDTNRNIQITEGANSRDGSGSAYFYQLLKISGNGTAVVYGDKDQDGQNCLQWRSLLEPGKVIRITPKNTEYGQYMVSDCGQIVTYVVKDAGSSYRRICQYHVRTGQNTVIYDEADYDTGYIEYFHASPDGKQVYWEVATDPDFLVGWEIFYDEMPEEWGCFWWREENGTEKICQSGLRVNISPDGTAVCIEPTSTAAYGDTPGLYRKEYGKDPVLLSENGILVDQFVSSGLGNWMPKSSWYSMDYSTMYYREDGQLWRIKENGAPEAVDEVEYLYPHLYPGADEKESWPELRFVPMEEIGERGDVKGELYMDGQLVDTEVVQNEFWGLFQPEYNLQTKTLMYFIDALSYKEEYGSNWYGTMMLYKNGEKIEVAQDVYKYHMLKDGRILYWKNNGYVRHDDYGEFMLELYFYDGKDSVLISENVTGVCQTWEFEW